MKRIYWATIAIATILTCSCTNFLDIVPDNVATLDNAFTMRTSAERALHTCYSYIPDFHTSKQNPGIMGCGDITILEINRPRMDLDCWYLPQGFQTAAEPYCNFWDGELGGGEGLFNGIRDCNSFLDKVDSVPDLDTDEKLRWIDEVKFLKAYFHFYLVRMYGPIPIVDKNMEVSASIEDVHVRRNTLDECFKYIVGLLDEILDDNHLPDVIELETSELGRITNGIVLAFKAQVLMYAASPLFNGNTDYKGYKDKDGVEIFCPDKTDADILKRWKDAAEACEVAINFLESYDYGLYVYSENEYNISEDTRYMLSRRGSFTASENCESIWCYTNQEYLQKYGYPGRFLANENAAATSQPGYQGTYSVPIEIAELYYTDHGLPMEEDKTFNYAGKFDIVTSTSADALYIKPDYNTVRFHFNREYRFYSDLAFDGSYWFGNNVTTENEPNAYLQPRSNQLNGNTMSEISNCTGYYPRKMVNIKTTFSSSGTWTENKYYFPILSMRSLYLYYAEALNEIGAPTADILTWVDMIRSRSGVPDVKTSYDTYSNNPRKYATQEGMRDIIHRERTIEMMFEGERMWDLRRWKEAYSALNKTYTGWNTKKYLDNEYYSQVTLFNQVFETKDYFWPIKNSEIYSNTNLIQNPGW